MRPIFKCILVLLIGNHAFANEGVSTQIDPARLNEVKEWVENAKYTLDTNLEDIQRSNVRDQESRLENLVETILRQSGEKPNEFLMRNVLHRTKVVYASIKDVPSSPKRDVLARRLLEGGVTWAQRMYEPDLNLVKLAREGKLTEVLRGTEFAKLGIEWADYMLELYYLAPTNKVKFQMMNDLMGLMYNDINNDDAVKRLLAPISGAIVSKHQDLQKLNVNAILDYLVEARDLRRFIEQQIRVSKQSLGLHAVEIASSSIEEQPVVVVSQNRSVEESTEILARCNSLSNSSARQACLSVKASDVLVANCNKFNPTWTGTTSCLRREGHWRKYDWNRQSDIAIAESCSTLGNTNAHNTCMSLKVSVQRVIMCNSTQTWSENISCLKGEGVWANY